MGLKIKIARIKKGIKVKELAKKVGISYQYLSDIERGKYTNISLKLLKNIAKELDLKVSDIIDD